jgi:hypothetical protein
VNLYGVLHVRGVNNNCSISNSLRLWFDWESRREWTRRAVCGDSYGIDHGVDPLGVAGG